ncbi:MAG TPA: hypothetical protein VM915_17670 [Verrucomicrobiae bacterium]|nr:hypothetical protein [Verrucomicrobiae bacterium]
MKRFAAFAAAAALAACVPTMAAAPAGGFDTGSGLAVNLQNSWTHIPPAINYATTGSVLTRQGVSLQRVDILTLEPGESIVRVPRNTDAPEYRAGMSETELVELVTASLTRLGYTDIVADNIRAHQLASAPGVRFNIAGKYSSGLNLRGDAALAESGGKLNIIIFVAPAAHYYEASAAEVDQLIQSAHAGAS